MAKQLRALAALEEDPGSVTSIYFTWQLPDPGDLLLSSGSKKQQACKQCTDMHAGKHSYVYIKINESFKKQK